MDPEAAAPHTGYCCAVRFFKAIILAKAYSSLSDTWSLGTAITITCLFKQEILHLFVGGTFCLYGHDYKPLTARNCN